MKEPTEKQFRILKYLVGYVRTNFRQPTLSELGEEFGVTPEAVRGHLLALEKKELIEYSDRGSRNIHITDEAFDLVDAQ